MKIVTQFVVATIATFFIPHSVYAACGTVEVSKGDIKIESAATHVAKAAPAGSKICSGDKIIAGRDSRAKLKMEDGNELNVSPDSQIVLETYQFNAAENKKKVLLNVLSGKVRATTKKENMYNDRAKDGQANTFEVRTKSAVAGVRGTDFLTSYDPQTQTTEVVTFRGRVEVAQASDALKQPPTSVVAGQKTQVQADQAPSAPRAIPASELSRVNQESRADAAGPKTEAPAATPASESKPEPKESKPESRTEPKSEANRDEKPEVKPEVRPEPKSEARPGKPEIKPEAKRDTPAAPETSNPRPDAPPVTAGTGSAPATRAPANTTIAPAPTTVAPPPPIAMGLPPANTIVLPPKIPIIPQINPCGAICDNAIQNRAAKVKIIIKREGI